MGDLLRIEKWAENLEEVTLNRWLKPLGSCLQAGESLCEIITDKATFEYEIERPGTLRQVYATEHSVLPVGFVIAFVGEPDEPLPTGINAANEALMAERQSSDDLILPAGLVITPARSGTKKVRATPAARRAARENRLEIDEIAAWLGAGELVDEAAVERYREAKADE